MTKHSTDTGNPVAQLRDLAEGLWPEKVSSVELIRELRWRADVEFTDEQRCILEDGVTVLIPKRVSKEVKDK